MAPWRPNMQLAIQQLSTQVLNTTSESKRAVKQLLRYLKGTHNTCLRLEPYMTVQKGRIELVGRGDSDWAGVLTHLVRHQGRSPREDPLRKHVVGDSQRTSET